MASEGNAAGEAGDIEQDASDATAARSQSAGRTRLRTAPRPDPTGDYGADQRLPGELELAARFLVSRPIVREALQRLREEGPSPTAPRLGNLRLLDTACAGPGVLARLRAGSRRSPTFSAATSSESPSSPTTPTGPPCAGTRCGSARSKPRSTSCVTPPASISIAKTRISRSMSPSPRRRTTTITPRRCRP